MSGYAARCCAATSGPPYVAGFGASLRSARTDTKPGGFSVSVVMSWIIGTSFAILYQFPGTPNASAPRTVPATAGVNPRRPFPGRPRIAPAKESIVPAIPR